MIKTAPRLGQLAAMALFALSVVGLTLFLWAAFGGTLPLKPQGFRFKAAFPEASLLVAEADVRLAGVNVGKVKTKELAPGGRRTVVEMEIEERYAPIRRDTKAILRQKSLLGETYVELTPGGTEAEALEDGGTLPRAQVEGTVELDEIFGIFDEPTKRNFRAWLHEAGIVTSGTYARDFNNALGNIGPFFEAGADALAPLDAQELALRRLVRNTGRVFDALTERDGQLRDLPAGEAEVGQDRV
ncbi:MAG TPA: MlaD family protein, partial [Thermoleophilaceae bacterium]|nr:MlaD family protein [Thermoleophilaceae bacterium]